MSPNGRHHHHDAAAIDLTHFQQTLLQRDGNKIELYETNYDVLNYIREKLNKI